MLTLFKNLEYGSLSHQKVTPLFVVQPEPQA
jgi:hypothetical protein